MKRKRYTEEQIISILKENEAGVAVRDLVRKYGVSEQSIDRGRAKYGGMDVSDARRLKALEEENRRLFTVEANEPRPDLKQTPTTGWASLRSATPYQ